MFKQELPKVQFDHVQPIAHEDLRSIQSPTDSGWMLLEKLLYLRYGKMSANMPSANLSDKYNALQERKYKS